jgi:protoglobin
MARPRIPGYAFGTGAVPRSPVSLAEFELMKETALFGEDDVRYLRMSRFVLEDQVDDVLDAWYGYVRATPHILHAFVDRETGAPDEKYLAAVRERFRQWVLDTAAADYGHAWLDWQIEIGRRHHRTGKNVTDGANTAPIVPFRYLPTMTYALLATLRPFLARKGHPPADVEGMHAAWTKSLLLQVTLWCHPYVKERDF